MTHQEIKATIDSLGFSYFQHYDSLFESVITNDKNARYTLKAKPTSIPVPAELGNNLKVRIYTQNFKVGNNCLAIGIPGRFVFDKIKQEKKIDEEVYLLQYTMVDGTKIKNEIDQINCKSSEGFAIDPPFHVTVLNLRNIPESKQKESLRKFVTAYLEETSPGQRK